MAEALRVELPGRVLPRRRSFRSMALPLSAGLLIVKSLPFTEQLLSLDQKILAHPGKKPKTSHAQVLESALVWFKRNGATFQPKYDH